MPTMKIKYFSIFFFIIFPLVSEGQVMSHDTGLASPSVRDSKVKRETDVHVKFLKTLRGGSKLYLMTNDNTEEKKILLKREAISSMDTLDSFNVEDAFFIEHDFPNYVVCSVNGPPTPGSPISGPVLYGIVIDKQRASAIWRDSGYSWYANDTPEGEVVSLKGKDDLTIFTIATQVTEHYTISQEWDHIWDISVTKRNVIIKYTPHGGNQDEKHTKKVVLKRSKTE